MVIFNGIIKDNTHFLSIQNRGLEFGDSVFETMKVVDEKIIFFEDHYFRLMASMRIMRMEIPMSFTMDFFQEQILALLRHKNLLNARIRLTIFRKEGGLFAPDSNKVDYIIEASEFSKTAYQIHNEPYKVDLYKDFKKNSGLLSTIKSNNKLEHVLAGIYAHENELDNVLLLNQNNRLTEAINANIFIVNGNTIITPKAEEGCIKGIIRKKVIEYFEKNTDYELIETEVNHFELMKADEVFLTNIIIGVQPITHFRKKVFTQQKVSQEILSHLNHIIS